MKAIRLFFFLLFTHFSFLAVSQKIDFRNDSLFVNGYFIDGRTSKSTLDSLLNEKGRLKRIVGKYKPGTLELSKWSKIIYNKSGLIFTKKDYDSLNLSLSIKLYKNSNAEIDYTNMPTKTFKGTLFIDSNYMNDKKTVDQLQKLKNCSFSCKESTISGQSRTIFCNILYRQREIRGIFDFKTNTMTCIFIY